MGAGADADDANVVDTLAIKLEEQQQKYAAAVSSYFFLLYVRCILSNAI